MGVSSVSTGSILFLLMKLQIPKTGGVFDFTGFVKDRNIVFDDSCIFYDFIVLTNHYLTNTIIIDRSVVYYFFQFNRLIRSVC